MAMTNKITLTLGALCALAIIALVRTMDVPVDDLGGGIASTLQRSSPEIDDLFFPETSWALPYWLLKIDNAIGGALLLIMFFGGLPIGLAAIVLRGHARRVSDRAILTRLVPYFQMFQFSSLLLAMLATTMGIVFGGAGYLRSAWAWYQAATIVVSLGAIPAWRQFPRPAHPGVAVFPKTAHD
jgi:hypothetical protein